MCRNTAPKNGITHDEKRDWPAAAPCCRGEPNGDGECECDIDWI